MMAKKNVGQTVRDGLCMGCGVCQDACARQCIRIHHGKDVNEPVVDEKSCTECGLCLKVCAGRGIEMGKIACSLYEDAKYNPYLGYYDQCFSGYSKDYDIRYHSASGGCVSQFLIWLLENKHIDGAVVVGFKAGNPMKPKTYIAKNREEIIAAKSSKYCVTSYEGILSEMKEEKGKYVVVGLPCQIQAFRKYTALFNNMDKCIVGYFSIYCSSNRTMRSQDFLLYRYGVKREDVARFAYRDNGCLGEMVFEDKEHKVLKSVPYQVFWQGMRGFFNVPRCSMCIDHFGELADVSFGDIHIGEYINDHIGVNSVISRSPKWTGLLKEAAKDGCLQLDEISHDIVVQSQPYTMRQKKGCGVVAAFKLRRLMGKRNPEYDVPFVADSCSVKDVLVAMTKCCMREVGKQKWLWGVICKL